MRALLFAVFVIAVAAAWFLLPGPGQRVAVDRQPGAKTHLEAPSAARALEADPVRVAVEGDDARALVAPTPNVVYDPTLEPAEVFPLMLHVRVIDTLGNPAEGARVSARCFPLVPASFDARAADAPIETNETRQGLTDSTGNATLGFHASGAFRVAAEHADGATQSNVTLDLGEHTIELQLAPVFQLHGFVRDAHTLAPIAGAQLELFPASLTGRGEFASDHDGRFEFSSTEGVQILSAIAPGYPSFKSWIYTRSDAQWSYGIEGEAQPLDAPVEVLLTRERQIEGRVIDPNGTPIADALVTARGYVQLSTGIHVPDAANARTDAHGRFVLTGLRADVTHVVWASDPNYAAAAAVVETSAPDRDVGTMQLGPATAVRGHAQHVDADGTTSPAPGVQVTMVCAADLSWERLELTIPLNFELETLTDDAGDFVFRGAPLGQARLRGAQQRGWFDVTLVDDYTQLEQPLKLRSP